jgi:hypothetical protein
VVYGIRDSWVLWGARRFVRSLPGGSSSGGGGGSVAPRGYTWHVSNVVFYKPVIDSMLRGPSGLVARHLHDIGRDIQTRAKRLVGIKTGRLRNSIRVNPRTTSLGEQAVEVGSKLKYAYVHHEGSRPHLIVPVKRTHLKFRAGARIVYTKMVRHPGTRPNRYLTNAMRIVVGNL